MITTQILERIANYNRAFLLLTYETYHSDEKEDCNCFSIKPKKASLLFLLQIDQSPSDRRPLQLYKKTLRHI
jgi:hypothetical protein